MFKLSVAANVLLGALVAGLVLIPRTQPELVREATTPGSAVSGGSLPAVTAADRQECNAPAPVFRWSQLESTNYRTYMANLRAIGCPEQTIRDIVVADVHTLYAMRRNRLAPGEDVHDLSAEEASLLASLLGAEAAPEGSLATPPAYKQIEGTPPITPLVLRDPDLRSLPLTPEQAKVIADLQQQFRQRLGTASPEPNDPAYRRRWQAAQADSDSMLRGLLGEQFYLDYEVMLAGRGLNQ
jgi:hypothetical protein